MTIKKIYLSEAVGNKELDYGFINTDVIVQLEDDYKFRANFIAIKKLVHDIEAHRELTKGPAKKYFWSKNMVIVSDLKQENLWPMIEYMIEEGDFQLIFEKLS